MMLNPIKKPLIGIAILGVMVLAICGLARANTAEKHAVDKTAVNNATATQTLLVAGGCFWGVEAVFEHVKGVVSATSGYAGGAANTANYDRVSDGDTGHAESVQITYDPAVVKLEKLLDVYFKVAHDPTQLNYQGPDHGTQYRSAIFIQSPEQKKIVQDKIAALTAQHAYRQPIVTTLEPYKEFYTAENYHQNYLASHTTQPYIVMHDLPKLAKLKETFPELYKP